MSPPAAKHQNAAVARLQPILITKFAVRLRPLFIIIKMLEASSLPLLWVVAVDKGTTLLDEPPP
jgi:hypothetical protein